MFKKFFTIFSVPAFLLLLLFSVKEGYAQTRCCYTSNNYRSYRTDYHSSRYYVYRRVPTRSYVVINNSQNRSCSKEVCLPFSIPYNIPDGWLLSHMNGDPEYTRSFEFKDITNECRYAIKTSEVYKAWCMDQNLMATPGYDYMTRLFNFFQALPDYGRFDTPKGNITIFDFFYKDYNGNYIPFDKILYIINNKEGYSKAEVQEAIWYYTMGERYVNTHTSRYKELIEAAEMYGDHYIPPCNGDGKLFLFALTKAAENTGQMQMCETGQPFIVEMPVPQWMCDYGVLDDLLGRIYSSYDRFLDQEQNQNQNQNQDP